MIYRPYIIDAENKSHSVLGALILYELAYMFWALTLFNSRISSAIAGLAGILLLIATVWLGWVCYHLYSTSIYFFILLLLWILYLQNYTLNVME